jgi:hypothetical protein
MRQGATGWPPISGAFQKYFGNLERDRQARPDRERSPVTAADCRWRPARPRFIDWHVRRHLAVSLKKSKAPDRSEAPQPCGVHRPGIVIAAVPVNRAVRAGQPGLF